MFLGLGEKSPHCFPALCQCFVIISLKRMGNWGQVRINN